VKIETGGNRARVLKNTHGVFRETHGVFSENREGSAVRWQPSRASSLKYRAASALKNRKC